MTKYNHIPVEEREEHRWADMDAYLAGTITLQELNDREEGKSRQHRRWADTRLYLNGEISLEEYEERERAYEPNYVKVMLALAEQVVKEY